jgi:hypothetical protein
LCGDSGVAAADARSVRQHARIGELPNYRVLLRGHLAPAPLASELQPRGFYVTRIVTASDATGAGRRALQLVQTESKYERLVESYHGRAPDLAVEEVIEAPSSDQQAVNRSGYVFYEDEE